MILQFFLNHTDSQAAGPGSGGQLDSVVVAGLLIAFRLVGMDYRDILLGAQRLLVCQFLDSEVEVLHRCRFPLEWLQNLELDSHSCLLVMMMAGLDCAEVFSPPCKYLVFSVLSVVPSAFKRGEVPVFHQGVLGLLGHSQM